jgi:translation initiation factor IF-2
MSKPTPQKKNVTARPPVISVMGHIDHGKSTLLDYIRKTNIVDKEAGGITQHISAYEFEHTDKTGRTSKITFLDTPGHEAFTKMRVRGANIADIAVLVVSAEDGVKPQTLDAYSCIKDADIPFVVAINKIDKPNADIERTKQSLAEHEIYLEGYGGTTAWVPISAKEGTGVNDLLDTLLLMADLEGFIANPDVEAQGTILESKLDKKKGISATLIIKNGTLKQGMYVVAGSAFAPVRIFEDFKGTPIKEARFSSPVRIIGWNDFPTTGTGFSAVASKKEAEEIAEQARTASLSRTKNITTTEDAPVQDVHLTLPVIIKADVAGTLEAVEYELSKIKDERVTIRIISKSVGDIRESDIKSAIGMENTLVLGFSVKLDATAKTLSEQQGVTVVTFDIIYKLSEWLIEHVQKLRPRKMVQEVRGKVKIIKIFSTNKDKQLVGGKVYDGTVKLGDTLVIKRRDNQIGEGKIKELQVVKEKVKEVESGKDCGMQVETKIEIVAGDVLECLEMVER